MGMYRAWGQEGNLLNWASARDNWGYYMVFRGK